MYNKIHNTDSSIKDLNKDYTLFPWANQSKHNPIEIVDAKGVYLYDKDGKSYLDFSSGLMNVNVGHKNTKINNAIKDQLDKFAYVNPALATEPRGELGKKLVSLTKSNMQKVFFTCGGADSIENAIMIARVVTGRNKIITKYRSYHGATYGAVAAGGDPRKFPIDQNQMSGVIHVEDPYCYRCPWSQEVKTCKYQCADHVERIIKFEGPENIAAILMEGESGTSGCIKYPKDYWPKIAAIAKKYNIMIIVDEVMSGFGRCGEWFAINQYDIEPDIIVCAKGINSGYVPLGAVIVSKQIAEYFDNNIFPSGLTYSAHTLALASALANIEYIEEENLLDKTRKINKYLTEKVEKLRIKHKSIGDFRSTGLLGCIELVKNQTTKEALVPWNAKPEESVVSYQIIAKLRELGLITFIRWNHLFIAPPLTITRDELNEGLDKISEALLIADAFCT